MAKGSESTLKIDKQASLFATSDSISRLRQRSLFGKPSSSVAKELEQQAAIELDFGTEKISALPSAWVRNGPPDQSSFHKTMIEMQLSGLQALGPEALARRFSMLQAVDGVGDTYQVQLEKPKPVAVSWNSNYGSHGWHRYVGRFPPHVVRALLNLFGANSTTVVCDPFLGSGTTAVECRLLGIPFIGIEICPLSCLMSRTKSTFPVDATSLSVAPVREHRETARRLPRIA